MWLAPFFPNPLIQDIIATVIAFAVALGVKGLIDTLAARGLLEQTLSRKLIHIGMGPVFLLTWNFFSTSPNARFFAALVPLAITAQFALVGLGIIKDESAVQSMSRTGDRREVLRGPLYYGIVFVVVTVVFWRHSPIGILALMLLCGGDGLADVFGRRFGHVKLPFNGHKSFVGSLAMFGGGFVFGLLYLLLFNAFGNFTPPLSLAAILINVTVISLAGTLIESLPLHELDNITIPVAALAIGLILF